MIRSMMAGLILVMMVGGQVGAGVGPQAAKKLYDEVSPSLVAVQYTWESELGRREIIGAGIVVATDGLVMTSLAIFDPRIPDEQMKDFKIIVPRTNDEPQELEAVFEGRDERTALAFLKTKEPQGWKAVKFSDSPVTVGQPIISIGLLPKTAGYRTYFKESVVSAVLRGETPQVMVDGGGLTAVGSPVFTTEGKAIGFVNFQAEQSVLLNNPNTVMAAINNPPQFFVPAYDFLPSLANPPHGEPLKLPWIGVLQLNGLKKDVSEYFGLKNQPAIEVGEIIANSPAEKGGMKAGQIIVKMNGQPLERGDEPEELPQILQRKITRMNVGDKVTFSVLQEKGAPLKDITITLEERPHRSNVAKRFYAEDLGFVTRDLVFYDAYSRKLPADSKGVIVAMLRPQSSAQSGHLEQNDMVTELNGEAIVNVAQFMKSYQDFRKQKPREAVVMVVIREAKTQTIRIEPPQ